MIKHAALLSPALLSVVLLAGCAQDEFADLRAQMEQAGSGTQQPLEPLPPVKPLDTFTYEPGDMLDPFKPRSMKPSKGGSGFQPDLTRPKGPLEQYPLDALRMVGTLQQKNQLYALIRTPDNTLYRVRKGDYMGLNYGLVVALSETAIELRETVQDGAGDWTETKAAMALQE
jgi:type IV pilus assembly protein PilP